MSNYLFKSTLHTLTPFLLFCACAGDVPSEKPAMPATAPVYAPTEPAASPTAPLPGATTAPAAPETKPKAPVSPKPLPAPEPVEAIIAKNTNSANQTAAQSSPLPVIAPATPTEKPLMSVGVATALNHENWNKLLVKHVNASGKVDYKGFKADKAALDAYCEELAAHTPQNDWSRGEKMAYWINAYNAFTIQLITDHYPLTSILKLDGGKTWDVKRIQLGDKKYSLNQIENEILRPQFKDPRIHVAINCAAKSCPPLLNKAYTAENLEQTLDERARKFINNAQYNTISTDRAQLSKIFDWYAADFPDLKKFVNQYSSTKLNASAIIEFKEYDWDLNQ
ncbi:MAG: DUF547 domain-containing protein [Bacteroidota bacterium]